MASGKSGKATGKSKKPRAPVPHTQRWDHAQLPPTPEYLLAPQIRALLGTAGSIGEDGTEIPPLLAAFLDDGQLVTLCTAHHRQPGLYWHPLVRQQIEYLRALGSESRLWIEFGWDPSDESISAPPEAIEALAWLRRLIQAHAEGMARGGQFDWKATTRLGRRSEPLELRDEEGRELGTVEGHDLWIAYQEVAALRLDVPDRLPRALPDRAARIAKPLAEAMNSMSADPTWATLRPRYKPPTERPEGFETWKDWKQSAYLALYGTPVWNEPTLAPALEAALGDEKFAARESKLSRKEYLSYLIVAALLGVRPSKVRDRVEYADPGPPDRSR